VRLTAVFWRFTRTHWSFVRYVWGGRRQLAHLMTFEKFKFNYENPTGSWMLDLSLRAHRDVLAMLHAVHMEEMNFSRNCSTRGDTSQKGNWTNFRNERLNQQPFVMTPEWCTNIPHRGSLEFDYVSTTRPPRDVLYAPRRTDLMERVWPAAHDPMCWLNGWTGR